MVDTDNSTLPSLEALKLARVTQCVEPSNVISCPVQKQALDVLDGLQLCLSSSHGKVLGRKASRMERSLSSLDPTGD